MHLAVYCTDMMWVMSYLTPGFRIFLKNWQSLSWWINSLLLWNINALYLIHKRPPMDTLPYVLHARPPHPPRFNSLNSIWWWIQMKKSLIMQFFLSLVISSKPEIFPSAPCSQHLSSTFFLQRSCNLGTIMTRRILVGFGFILFYFPFVRRESCRVMRSQVFLVDFEQRWDQTETYLLYSHKWHILC